MLCQNFDAADDDTHTSIWTDNPVSGPKIKALLSLPTWQQPNGNTDKPYV
jgi:hypothetical protein